MKNLLFLNLFIFSSIFSSAQIQFEGDKNYYKYAMEVDSLISNELINKSSIKKFNRNHLFYKDRLYPSGQLFDYQKEMIDHFQNFNFTTDSLENLPEWYPIGSTQIVNPANNIIIGNGRISFIKFHPYDLNKIYVGSATGAVWTSNDNGNNWEILSETLPCRGYSDLAIDTLTQSMYLLSGDFDGRDSPFYGIFKSQDDGQTWEKIDSLNIPFGKKIMTHPSIENLIYVVARDGFYYSTDGGYFWEKNNSLPEWYLYDLDFDLNNDSTLYVFARDTLFYSQNLGIDFEHLYDLDSIHSGPAELVIHPISNSFYIGTSPPFSLNIGYGSDAPGIFKSIDEGATFDLLPGSDTLRAKQQNYNMIFGVSPQIDEKLFIGWVNAYFQTSDDTWAKGNKNQFIHADYHCYAFDPKDSNCLLVGNDGGLYRSCDFGQSWENISGNMNLTQIYNFGNSNTCEDLILIGTQDNGTAVLDGNNSSYIYGGDGFSCGFSLTSNDTAFFSIQNQFAYRQDSFYQFLETFEYSSNPIPIKPDGVAYASGFKTRLKLSKTKAGLLYFINSNKIYKSSNYGNDYNQIASNGSVIYDFELSPQNSDYINLTYREYIYDPEFSVNDYIKYSLDQGNTWTSMLINYTSYDTLPISVRPIPQALTFDPLNEGKIWVATNRTNSHQVLFSQDFGATWEDYSDGLPNIKLNDILFQPYSNDAIYLATDAGIYFRNDTLDSWIPFNNNLPQTIFTEIKISNVAEKLRVSSYGMGIWETDLYGNNQHPPISNFECHKIKSCKGQEYQWTHSSSYSPDSVVWIFEGGTPEFSYTNNPTVTYESTGLFSTTLITINDFGRDTLVRNHSIFIVEPDLQIDSFQIDDSSYQLSTTNNLDSIIWSTGETTSEILVTESGWYSATVINDMGCTKTDSIYIEIIPTSIDEIEKINCLIFPNPSLGQIQIDCINEDNDLDFRIFNLLGQPISNGKFKTNTILQLPVGICTIQIVNDKKDEILRKKIIILKEK